MPRNGSGIFSLPAGYAATAGNTATASQHNTPLEDIASDLNTARPVVSGGTGATTTSDARDNLGVTIGTDVQAYDAGLQSIAGLTTAADKMIYATASDVYAVSDLSSFARTLLDDADAPTARTTMGLAIGTDVQAHGDVLDDLNTLGAATADGEFIVASAAGTFAYESGATARTSLGLGSIATQASDSVNIDGGAIDGTVIGGNAPAAGSFTTLNASGDVAFDTDGFFFDQSAGNVGIGTSSPLDLLGVNGDISLDHSGVTAAGTRSIFFRNNATDRKASIKAVFDSQGAGNGTELAFYTNAAGFDESEVMRLTSVDLLVGKTSANRSVDGVELSSSGASRFTADDFQPLEVNRENTNGALVVFYESNTAEGSISVSGTAVSYNGGHLARWSRLPDGTDDSKIYRGTVMTNLDAMCEWRDEGGDLEDNEQLNKTTVSSIEGDKNVAGVFVAWDEDDDWGDYYLAMTGDLVIRIAQGTTVQRGDLLMSAGDGTAKPQADDLVRSSTIAKVTSTHISHEYPDGSYAVPCVVMAC